jgi:hypothetical protein
VAIILVVGVAVVSNARAGGGGSGATPTPTSAASLASTDGQAQGRAVDGISCQTSEQIVYHIHAHLAVYVNGVPRTILAGVGIVPPIQRVQTTEGLFVTSGKCFYWLHSPTQDGVIHIESPTELVYTLGNYFDNLESDAQRHPGRAGAWRRHCLCRRPAVHR